jgi:hypothetical protein
LVIYCHTIRVLPFASRSLAAGNEVDEHHDNGDHEQDVNEPAHRGTGQQPQRPQNEQNYRKSPQHMIFLSV